MFNVNFEIHFELALNREGDLLTESELQMKTEEELHPDLRGHERAHKGFFVIVSYCLPILIGLFVVYSYAVANFNVLGEMPIVGLLLISSCFLPDIVKSGYEKDASVLIRATEVFAKEKPQRVFVDYVYKTKYVIPNPNMRVGPPRFFYYIVFSDEKKAFQSTDQIYFVAPEMRKFTSTIPLKDDVDKLQDQYKDRHEANAYVDPETKMPVLIETENRRIWLIDLPPHL